MEENTKKYIIWAVKILIPLMIAVISFFPVAKWAGSPDTYKNVVESLDNKRDDVLKLTSGTFGASAAITVIPGDIGTPIADKLADLSGYFVLILCIIYLEKYLVTLAGMVAFKIILPIACGVFIVSYFWLSEKLKLLSARLAAFAIILALLIPASTFVSDKIEHSNDYTRTMEEATVVSEEILGLAGMEEAETVVEEEEGKGGFLGAIIGFTGEVTEDIKNKVTVGYAEIKDKIKNVLSKTVDAVALLIVTSCLIPVGVLLFFVYLTKLLFNMSITPWIFKRNKETENAGNTD
jgi:hypothetical protein